MSIYKVCLIGKYVTMPGEKRIQAYPPLCPRSTKRKFKDKKKKKKNQFFSNYERGIYYRLPRYGVPCGIKGIRNTSKYMFQPSYTVLFVNIHEAKRKVVYVY